MRFLPSLALTCAVLVSGSSSVSASSASIEHSAVSFNSVAFRGSGLGPHATEMLSLPVNSEYGFSSSNNAVPNVPYPPHCVEPIPIQERFTLPQIFGAATTSLLSVPFPEIGKRNPLSGDYNTSVFTSISDMPKPSKSRVAQLTSIDIFGDEYFGLMRFIGPHSAIIKRITTVSSKFGPIDTLRAKYPQLSQWATTGQLFELDYALLQGTLDAVKAYPLMSLPQVSPGLAFYKDIVPQMRYLNAPYVLLAHVVESGESKLVPIAIQLDQTYVEGKTAVVYRTDYKDNKGQTKLRVSLGDWQYAKMIANTADGTLHQLDAHLVKTHLIMENIITGTHIALPEDHVVSRLILGGGHSYKNLAIDVIGRSNMLPGMLGTVFASGFVGTAKLTSDAFTAYNWINDYVPNDLTTRGFGDFVTQQGKKAERKRQQQGTDTYFYAQDAITIWEIIADFVEKVLHKAYPNDRAVAADEQLQAWATLLSTHDASLTHAPVPGFPSSLPTRECLTDAVTGAIYKSTVAHSVVNYPQPDFNAYPPVYPAFALYRPILTASQLNQNITNDAYLAGALGTAGTMDMIRLYVSVLGQPIAESGLADDITLLQYAQQASLADPEDDDRIGAAIQQSATRLLKDLSSFQQTIQTRDASFQAQGKAHLKYGYFDPSLVANAIYA